MTSKKIELFYFDGCPTYKIALKDLEEVARELGVRAKIETVRVGSDDEARSHRFIGSPTIRVNGEDIDPAASGREDYGMSCRVYRVNGKLHGHPPKEMIRTALAGLMGCPSPPWESSDGLKHGRRAASTESSPRFLLIKPLPAHEANSSEEAPFDKGSRIRANYDRTLAMTRCTLVRHHEQIVTQ